MRHRNDLNRVARTRGLAIDNLERKAPHQVPPGSGDVGCVSVWRRGDSLAGNIYLGHERYSGLGTSFVVPLARRSRFGNRIRVKLYRARHSLTDDASTRLAPRNRTDGAIVQLRDATRHFRLPRGSRAFIDSRIEALYQGARQGGTGFHRQLECGVDQFA